VGSYEMLRLCDKTGWTYSFSKPEVGSLLKLAWSKDGTVIGGAGGNGSVMIAHVVGRHIEWANIEATLDEDNKITVNDCLHELNEDLDFRDRVINMSLRHNHLVVATTTQCCVYNVMNLTSPFVVDIKDTTNLII
jgi:intraflagellar transport protein 80